MGFLGAEERGIWVFQFSAHSIQNDCQRESTAVFEEGGGGEEKRERGGTDSLGTACV